MGNHTYAESDAHVTRKATTKRSSRSFASRITRTRSRKMEVVGKSAKPGITVDTSFARHRGNAPHQMYPQEGDLKSSAGSIKKHGWLGLGRSNTKTKGLGITKGTPQPDAGNDPKTAVSMTPGNEISPWDRRIPIGISIPSDSVTDFSPYQRSRNRSESDATIPTPSIIITPAAAMKSVWSPDTDSDYTPAPNIYMSHKRSDTANSAETNFEEEDDDDMKRKDRIMSTGTVFEEDDTPLRGKERQSALAVDTATTPNSRRSQGWWNIITTPFVMSRSNSVWTQNGPNGPHLDTNAKVPAMEQKPREPSPSTPSTYIWSATEKSPSSVSHEAREVPAQEPKSEPAGRNFMFPSLPSSPKPVVGKATSHSVENTSNPTPTFVNIELQERQAHAPVESSTASAQPKSLHIHIPAGNAGQSPPQLQNSQRIVPVFPPPPTSNKNSSRKNSPYHSRSSSPVSTSSVTDLKQEKKLQKKHRKANLLMSKFALCRRKKDGKEQKKEKKKRSLCFWCCGCCLIILVLLAILIPIIVVFTKKHNNPPPAAPPLSNQPGETSSRWLNLTGFPPMPTGVSTLAQPEAVQEQTGCVQPATAWSCAVPKEQHNDISPNKPDQPNFKFEIKFQNDTIPDASKTRPLRRAANPVSAGSFVRSILLNSRAAPSASPAAPSSEDRKFLGQTTEKVATPFEGEDTPFFISFQDAKPVPGPRLLKRQSGSDDNSSITALIPPPALNSDGTAAPANLLPAPSGQQLRLFNRGKDDEHYGFYTYFDRSIFLKTFQDDFGRGGNPSDTDGGSARDAATVRCTYAQTRFLVQIWTRSEATKPMLRGATTTNNSEATLRRPGTFPYPVTITVDRHGGDAAKKMLYCYRMEKDTSIINKDENKFFIIEDRSFGGKLANPANGMTNVTTPIDGGTGGCRCAWQNWLA
ncbi:hypothetical protein DM02DRAFT_510953 [Periconia macrospinosa]|uniref:Glycoprotease family protein n=1 Tax=Periconia macrospinosa TaxID=97972 RepID=A0A2V1ECJ7_9PLEO|nr:hypothetical protein DM02DRAFT_510953 [Periconia macrospinosa]